MPLIVFHTASNPLSRALAVMVLPQVKMFLEAIAIMDKPKDDTEKRLLQAKEMAEEYIKAKTGKSRGFRVLPNIEEDLDVLLSSSLIELNAKAQIPINKIVRMHNAICDLWGKMKPYFRQEDNFGYSKIAKAKILTAVLYSIVFFSFLHKHTGYKNDIQFLAIDSKLDWLTKWMTNHNQENFYEERIELPAPLLEKAIDTTSTALREHKACETICILPMIEPPSSEEDENLISLHTIFDGLLGFPELYIRHTSKVEELLIKQTYIPALGDIIQREIDKGKKLIGFVSQNLGEHTRQAVQAFLAIINAHPNAATKYMKTLMRHIDNSYFDGCHLAVNETVINLLTKHNIPYKIPLIRDVNKIERLISTVIHRLQDQNPMLSQIVADCKNLNFNPIELAETIAIYLAPDYFAQPQTTPDALADLRYHITSMILLELYHESYLHVEPVLSHISKFVASRIRRRWWKAKYPIGSRVRRYLSQKYSLRLPNLIPLDDITFTGAILGTLATHQHSIPPQYLDTLRNLVTKWTQKSSNRPHIIAKRLIMTLACMGSQLQEEHDQQLIFDILTRYYEYHTQARCPNTLSSNENSTICIAKEDIDEILNTYSDIPLCVNAVFQESDNYYIFPFAKIGKKVIAIKK